MNAYTIKWIVVTPVFGTFNSHYRSALRKAGLFPFGLGNDVFATHFNSENEVSVQRVQKALARLNKKLASYKRGKMILAFTITDKQFGLIGTNKIAWAKCKVPTTTGTIPVTYEQMYESGCIPLPGSQARTNHPNNTIFQ